MPSLYWKRGKWYCRVKGDKTAGRWSDVSTGEIDRAKAEEFATAAQKAIDKRRGIRSPNSKTLTEWVDVWLERREEAGHDWKKDRGRLHKHVLPVLGGLDLPDVTTAAVADLVHVLRFRTKLANRTARNIYMVLAAVMRDARIAGLIQQTPCVLTEVQLGSVIDKDPEWRASALFTRDELQKLISDTRIPRDRQLVYALGLLAGLRIGEGAALRWRNWDATRATLGCLSIARSYSTSRSLAKGTKTEAVRSVPVHPVLAEMLTEWRASGWAAMMKRDPEPDDLIVPLPPDVVRTKRKGERYRGWDYTGRRWRDLDLKALGWRSRSVYDTRATFITLALEDGADPDILEQRVTHTKRGRSAFGGYDRGERWAETCREVAKLQVRRLAAVVLPPGNPRRETSLRRRASNGQSSPPRLTVIQGGHGLIHDNCEQCMEAVAASLLTARHVVRGAW
jgi:integrase